MSYHLYKTATDDHAQILRKYRPDQYKHYKKLTIDQRYAEYIPIAMQALYRIPAEHREQEVGQLTERLGREQYWHHHGRPTLFISASLRNWLLECGSDVCVCEVRLPQCIHGQSLVICAENEDPVLITYHDSAEDVIISSKSNILFPIIWAHYERQRCSFHLRMERDDSATSRITLNRSLGADPYSYTDEEVQAELDKTKLILMVLSYCSTFPDAMLPGVPKGGIGGVPPAQSFRLNDKCGDERGQVVSHLRKGHFRALRHERFKRDERGQVRVVYVHASIIHREDVAAYVMQPEEVEE